MVTRKTMAIAAAAVLAIAALAYLRDPPWLISQATGLRRWEQQPGTPRYRWSGAHASFFVRADAGAFDIPLSSTFDARDDRPMMVTVSVDDETAARVVLTDAAWKRVRITLPLPGSRRVRRIDIRTSVTRDGNFGVRVGEIEIVPKMARSDAEERILSRNLPMPRLPTSMRAIEIAGHGGPDVLRVAERPVPEAKRGEVLIRVTAAGVNRPDIMQRLGKYPPPPGASDLPGLEVSGEIVAGEDVQIGRRVCALVTGGGYAEYCAVPLEQCLPIPASVTDTHAAAIPETYFTVWANLFERAALAPGERVLVHGGTSGIGTTAIQLAVARGATVIATAGTDEKTAACRRLGAARAINYSTEDFVSAVKVETRGEGVDVVLDIIGGDYLPRNLECLRMNGRLVQIGLIGGSKSALDLRPILQRRLTITGSTLRPRTPAEKGAIARALEREVWPLLERGAVKPIVHAEFPMERAADAHRELEAGHVIGKIVLTT